MIIDTAGDYTLRYTAIDECGNSASVDRSFTVEQPPRTVLYTDGTFIINELARDIDANVAEHGAETNVYAPFNPNGATDADKYIFAASDSRPWHGMRASINNVEIGSYIKPFSTAFWFYGFTACASFDLQGLDTSLVERMDSMFHTCRVVTELDLTGFDTHSVTRMENMFYGCFAVNSLDLTSFDTSSVSDMTFMFFNCSVIRTIYATSSFVVDQVTASNGMFNGLSNKLVGGAGTTWNRNNPTDKTYAHIDGGTSDPGYFTAKPSA